MTPDGEAGARRDPVVQLEPPLSQAPWSAEFVVQSLEVMLVHRAPDGGVRRLRPIHAESLWLGLGPGARAADIVVGALERYRLQPLVVHSTSWRQSGDRIVLTYVAVVDPPGDPSPHLVDEPVARADLARGEAAAAPRSIDVDQVLEHALRHLAWLVRDDPAVATALPGWEAALAAYAPEPFRAF